MDLAILNQLNNTEEEVNSEVIKSKKVEKKLLPTINKVEKNDITEKRERLVACVYLVIQNNI